MGAHFSPCGRYLVACVACVLPHFEADPGIPTHLHHERVGTSPTRHSVSAHQVMYELRIYSLEEATFGLVLISRPIRVAHCLTSIQKCFRERKVVKAERGNAQERVYTTYGKQCKKVDSYCSEPKCVSYRAN